ncbi:MAG TPA: hypothetical protein VE869_05415 [Gemmatimonas sp.]|nr:hypothetical protein [Gemmatimonas sp.]
MTALLEEIVAALAAADIPYMLTGSFAAAVHGAGRATMDVDFVIDPTPAALDVFVQRVLTSGRYISPEAAREALVERGMFNVVDAATGWKVDLIMRKERAFSHSEFARRSTLALGALHLPVATVEDLVLAKLEWAKLGGSARQLDDVRALLHAAGERFDHAYMTEWVESLGVGTQWRALRAENDANHSP